MKNKNILSVDIVNYYIKKPIFISAFYIKRVIISFIHKMAGVERIELPSKVLETPMLPLYHTPMWPLTKSFYHNLIYVSTKNIVY